MSKQDRIETGNILRAIEEGSIEALQDILSQVETPPTYTDAEVRDALMGLTPEGYERLNAHYGVELQELIDEMMKGR